MCAPLPGGSFAASICIVKDGDWSCDEMPPFTIKTLVYPTINDSRGCIPCSCGPPSGMTCSNGTTVLYGDAQCTTPTLTLSHPDACQPLPSFQSLLYTAGTSTGGSCIPGGTGPQGEAVPGEPVTVCCTAG